MKKPEVTRVEVDMVPLIDIVSLLLMFLIVIGDTTANTTSVQMKLPAASEAMKEWRDTSSNRIVVQLMKSNDAFVAALNGGRHDLAGNSLKEYIGRIIDDAAREKRISKRLDGTWDMPVKLRIPEDYPMPEVEKVLSAAANLQLVDIQYAAVKK